MESFAYLLSVYHIPPDFLPVDGNLINGVIPFNCTLAPRGTPCNNEGVPVAEFKLKARKIPLLRLVNAGGNGNQKFSIEDHELTVIANGFVCIQQ